MIFIPTKTFSLGYRASNARVIAAVLTLLVIICMFGILIYSPLILLLSTFGFVLSMVSLLFDNVLLNSAVAALPITFGMIVCYDIMLGQMPTMLFHLATFIPSTFVLFSRLKRLHYGIIIASTILYQVWIVSEKIAVSMLVFNIGGASITLYDSINLVCSIAFNFILALAIHKREIAWKE